MEALEVQMRFDDGGLAYRTTIANAMEAAALDPLIWKISWTDRVTNEHIRLVRARVDDRTVWVYDPIHVFGNNTV